MRFEGLEFLRQGVTRIFMPKNTLHSIEDHPRIKPCRASVLEHLTNTIVNHHPLATLLV
jgi:hypothetical protein